MSYAGQPSPAGTLQAATTSTAGHFVSPARDPATYGGQPSSIIHCPQAAWRSTTGVAPPTTPRECSSVLQVFHRPLPPSSAALYRMSHTAHYLTSPHITPHHITSHHIALHRIASHHITSHHTTSHHITSHHITSHHITSHHITSHHITSHHITSHHITSHHITSHHITSHHITSHHITSHHIKSHHVTSLSIIMRHFFKSEEWQHYLVR